MAELRYLVARSRMEEKPMQRELMRIAVVIFLICGWPTSVQANALSDSWKCAKNAGMSSVTIGADLYKKGEALAVDTGPMCITDQRHSNQALCQQHCRVASQWRRKE